MSSSDTKTLLDFPEQFTAEVRTPCYLISKDVIERNCQLLDTVQKRTGAKVLLALKAFALPAVFPLIGRYLHGICASGPVEARLGAEEFGKEVHTYAPAFSAAQFEEVVHFSDHIVFNSISQWHTHQETLKKAGKSVEIGLRVNPGHSEVEIDLYNPCLPGSRFGVHAKDLEGVDLSNISGLHFHALCEQNADVLARVLESFETRFGAYLEQMQWINLGGGHHITREDYDLDLLCKTIIDFRKRHNNIAIYLEPGEAVVLNGGVYVTQVLDIIDNGMPIAILDGSAETHLPDVLAMPYRPHIVGSGEPDEFAYSYRLGGISCLAGDIVGDYSFPQPLKVGARLILTDMALYSFIKNTTFNGVELPSLYTFSREDNELECVRSFSYEDYRDRIK